MGFARVVYVAISVDYSAVCKGIPETFGVLLFSVQGIPETFGVLLFSVRGTPGTNM